MTIGMWFTDDLAHVLRGISVAALPAGDSEYQAGFQNALVAVAVALGIPMAKLTSPCSYVELRPGSGIGIIPARQNDPLPAASGEGSGENSHD